jgi:hypothetical protein
MTSPAPEPENPAEPTLNLNDVSAEDVTVPTPEFTDPPPPETTLRTSPRRAWRQRKTTPRKAPAAPTGPNTVRGAVKSVPKPRRGAFVKPITQTYTSIGIMMMPLDPICANLFIVNAESVARAWDEAAYESDAVREMLTKFLQTSIAARVGVAHVPILMGMMLHHSKRAQDVMRKMGEGFAETVENNMRVGDMGNGVEEP